MSNYIHKMLLNTRGTASIVFLVEPEDCFSPLCSQGNGPKNLITPRAIFPATCNATVPHALQVAEDLHVFTVPAWRQLGTLRVA